MITHTPVSQPHLYAFRQSHVWDLGFNLPVNVSVTFLVLWLDYQTKVNLRKEGFGLMLHMYSPL